MNLQVHVEALGYVGLGFSPNGDMTGADVVIGWVTDDGTAIFHVSEIVFKLNCSSEQHWGRTNVVENIIIYHRIVMLWENMNQS